MAATSPIDTKAERPEQAEGASRLKIALTSFSWAFLGLAAVRIWIQCTMYDRYAYSDAGMTSVTINLVRAVFTGILVIIVLKYGFPTRARKLLGWFSVTAMTLASVLFLFDSQMAAADFSAAACTCAGLGIVWGGGMWMEFYLRLEPENALACTLLSLALGSAGGLVLGFLPPYVGTMVSIIMPTVSFVACATSIRIVDTAGGDPFASPDPAPIDARYDAEPRSTWVRLLIGLALFEFAIGVARGFPFGASFELAPAFQVIHQMTIVALSLGGLYLVLTRDRFISYTALWRFELIMVALGVILLATLEWLGLSLGSTCVAIANSFTLGILWYTCYDIGRHTHMLPYAVLGICWFVFMLAREIGRWFIILVAPHDDFVVMIVALMVVLLTICIAVVFGESIPRTRELFEDLRIEVEREASARKRVEAFPEAAALIEASSRGMDPEKQKADLMAAFGLTQREAEVIWLVATGRSKAEAGDVLFISENTVRSHVKNAYAKMDVHNKRELAQKCFASYGQLPRR